jgi:uncharacterized protein (TIGR03435 family)
MKKFIALLLALAALAVVQANAQDVTGTWQGTLAAGKGLRTVIKITKDDGVLKSMFYSIDQGGQPIPVTKTTLQGSELKFTIALLDLVYDGKVNADGNTITGTSTQGGQALALNLTRATPETAWAIPEPPAKLPPMAKDANPSFDVATIKPSKPDAIGPGFRIQGRQFSTFAATVNDLVSFAYGLHAKQLVGGPDWLATERFDIAAKPDGEGAPNQDQWKLMIKKLLAERFHLTTHEEKRELPVYVLTVAKTGPKLTKGEGDANTLGGVGFRAPGNFTAANATMADFAGAMQSVVLDRPVIDKTELTGRWSFALKWTPDDSQFRGLPSHAFPPPPEGETAPPPLFSAIQEQIGLKLEAVRAPVNVMVVDKVEKPSEN